MREFIYSKKDISNCGSKYEIGQFFKDNGVPMVLNGLSWEFDLENYNIRNYECADGSGVYKVEWELK